ncbi:hypothetical protein CALCODRAFT_507777 [Calocera cornea HHB12733]|uniref:Uncharacterized protein n=1 Tax=Calocera cornea HHB12733 TaxID=1353952 RepID=A0A165HC80_9BASI|nr:hypothetical protein CALCODRAFT_507777 [Calocera cornea HHB12733]
MPFRAFPTSKPVTTRDAPNPNYMPKLAPRRPDVIRPMVYMQDAMIDEFFGDTRAMKGKRGHGTHGLPQGHVDYGVELNYVDQNGIPWKDKVDRQQHQELLSSRSRTQIAAADAAAGLHKPYGMRQQQSWASFDSDSTPDEEADDHSSTGESFESDVMDRHIRTASTEFTGYIPSGNDRSTPLAPAAASYMPAKPKIVKGADAFPEPAPPKHLHPEATAHAPRPHGPSRRRQADHPVPQVARVDPVEQARLDFIRTALPPSGPPGRRSSVRSAEQTPIPCTSSKGRDVLSPDFQFPARASFESRTSSRAESSCPSLSNGHSGSGMSSRSPSSAASSRNDLPNTQAPLKLAHASVKEIRRASQTFSFLSRPAPQPAKKSSAGPPTVQPRGPPTIQPKGHVGQVPTHGPTKSVSSTSLRARFNSFSRPSMSAADISETGSLMGKNNVVSKGLGGFFKRSKN